jgi:RecB family exonuclease
MNERMAQARRQVIHGLLEEPGAICVFPSETIARFWLADYTLKGKLGATLLRKAVSYDTFRALFLPHHTRAPVNKVIRQIFALDLLESPAGKRLSWLVSPAHPEARSRFASSIATLLPQLDSLQLLSQSQPDAYGRLPRELREDIQLVDSEYRRFLDLHGLFEPRFEHPSLENLTNFKNHPEYRICFPEVIDGCDGFLKELGYPSWITTVAIPATEPIAPIEVFENEMIELRMQLRRIELLLSQGVKCADIAISAASLDTWRPYLEHEAAIRDIPLQFVEGLSPLAYPAGRFLTRLRDVFEHEFSLASMKEFLLDPSYPWKDIALHQKLIARAIELKIQRGAQRRQESDGWEWKLGLRAQDRELSTWYRRFKQVLITLMEAKTVAEIRSILFAFQDDHFIRTRWNTIADEAEPSSEGAQVFSFCLGQLDGLGQAMAAGTFSAVKNLFAVYLQILQGSRYVQKDRISGIPVYPYGLSAGILPRHHFIVGCNHEASEQVVNDVSMIPDSLWDQSLVLQRDVSAAFLSCYLGSGEDVSISMGRSTFNTTVVLPPSYFIEQDAVQDFDGSQANRLQSHDCIPNEEKAWAHGLSPASRVHASQKRWFLQAEQTLFGPKGLDFARNPAPPEVQGRLLRKDGLLRISATSLDSYSSCPMQWASRYLFDIEDEDFTVEPIDHRFIGMLLHDILSSFFQEITTRFGFFSEERLLEYHEILRTIMHERFSRLRSAPDAPSLTSQTHMQDLYGRLLPKIIEAERKNFNDTISTGFEVALSRTYPGKGYQLEGRIDRILSHGRDSSNAEGLGIVDYKKSHRESKKAYDQPRTANPSMQLPLYARLLMDQDGGVPVKVETASFYNIAKGSYQNIWKSGDEARLAELLLVLEEKLDAMAEGLESGDFRATPSAKTCSACGYRQICRRRYSIQ